MSTITTVNPASGRPLSTYEALDVQGVDAAVRAAAQAQLVWAAAPLEERARVLRAAAALLGERREELALLVTREMGKPLAESRAEVDKCGAACEYYAAHAAAFLSDEDVATSADRSWISYDPVGVVLAVMPWNFPLWQVFRFAAPALMAGNAALLKHSPGTSGCAVAVAEVLQAAGAPRGLFGVLLLTEADTPELTARVIADPSVGAVTLTGSERAGSAVAVAAGRAVKKTVLELGGSDPFVVLDDADIPATVAMAVKARYLNGGQSCISAKRFIVDRAVAEDFTARLVAAVAALRVGDPERPGTDIGPLARADLRENIDAQVRQSLDAGASLLTGGHPLDAEGFFYAPTVLGNVSAGMPVYDAETFGPVAAVIVVDGDEEAARVANDTPFGLGASVWTSDPGRGVAVGRQIRSGACFVNAVVASDVRMPFGGTRRSGYGRELAAAGIREFVNVRSWWQLDEPAQQAPAAE